MRRESHGSGHFNRADLAACGEGVVFEEGVRIFHPDRVHIGANVYVGHDTLLKGYHAGELVIGDDSWIGQQCFLHAAGDIHIGARVGVGPTVRILTSQHREAGRDVAILHSPIDFAPVVIEDDADIGVGAILMPGVTIGRGAQVGAGAVVLDDVPAYGVVAGVPARLLRERPR